MDGLQPLPSQGTISHDALELVASATSTTSAVYEGVALPNRYGVEVDIYLDGSNSAAGLFSEAEGTWTVSLVPGATDLRFVPTSGTGRADEPMVVALAEVIDVGWNRLRIDVDGAEVTANLNGTLVAENLLLPGFEQRAIGLHVSSRDDQPGVARFDNLQVFEFPPQRYALTVEGRTVSSQTVKLPYGYVQLSARPARDGTYVEETMVTLTASGWADAGFIFDRWTGACQTRGPAPTCTLNITQDTSVGVEFEPPDGVGTVPLTLNGEQLTAPSATVPGGTVHFDLEPLFGTFYNGTRLTLTAEPADPARLRFNAWGGACSHAGTTPICSLTVSGEMNVIASFKGSNLSPAIGLTVTTKSSDSIEVSWARDAVNVREFLVERAPNSSGPFSTVDVIEPEWTETAHDYPDKSVVGSTKYCYRVSVRILQGPVIQGDEVKCATTPAEGEPAGLPSAPTNLRAVVDEGDVYLAWQAPPPGEYPITDYTVESTDGQFQTTVSGIETSFIVTGLAGGDFYSFVVTARNAVGDSPTSQPSNEVWVPSG